jgi:hypothetical protein
LSQLQSDEIEKVSGGATLGHHKSHGIDPGNNLDQDEQASRIRFLHHAQQACAFPEVTLFSAMRRSSLPPVLWLFRVSMGKTLLNVVAASTEDEDRGMV